MATALKQIREGITAAQAKQFDRARVLLEQAAKESPNDALVWFWLAIVAPSPDAAISCLRRVMALDAAHDQAREALATLLVTQAAATSHTDRGQARALLVEASRLTPAAENIWLGLAAVTENHDERIDALRHAVPLAADQPHVRTQLRQALIYRATMLAQIERPKARAMLCEAADIDPHDPRVWWALSQLADTPAEAVEPLRELLRVVPGHAAGCAGLKKALANDARALAAHGHTADACARWREAIAIDADDVTSWLELAEVTTDEDETQRAVEKAFELNPADERVAAAMGRLRGALDATFELPADAFARFDVPSDAFARLEQTAEALAELASVDFESAAAPAPKAISVPVEPRAARPVAPPAPLPVVPAAVPQAAPPVAPTIESEAPTVPTIDIQAPAAVAPPPRNGNGSNGSRRTVMVVDDSPTIRKILGLTLERAGYKVVAEPDGESAVERLLQVVPDLILLDISMPKLDGYEVCKRIKKDPRTAHVPVVMLSGKDAFFDKVKGRMAGASEYLTKPFETPAVLAVVSNHCHMLEEVAHG